MGFLRERTIKGHEYFYWCKRTRSRKKSGGSGKVQATDILIGRHPLDACLAFYFHMNEIDFRSYAESFIQRRFSLWNDDVAVSIDWGKAKAVPQRGKGKGRKRATKGKRTAKTGARVIFKSLRPDYIDCRSSDYRKQRQIAQDFLDQIVSDQGKVKEGIQKAIEDLRENKKWTDKAEDHERIASEIRKDPHKTWAEIEDEYDEDTQQWRRVEVTYHWGKDDEYDYSNAANHCRNNADICLENYLKQINWLAELAPRKRRDEFKRTITM